MDRSRREFALTSHNIANAEDPHYAKIKINTSSNIIGDLPAGISIESYSVDTDIFLQNNYYSKISDASYASTIKDILQEASDLFGSPQNDSGIDAAMREAIESIEKLTHEPNSSSLKFVAVNSLQTLANKISETALGVHQLRHKVDLDLYNSLNEANIHVRNLFEANLALNSTPKGTLENISAYQACITTTEKLAQYFGLYNYSNDQGNIMVYTAQGDNLVTDTHACFKYAPLSTIDDFYNGTPFNSIKMTLVNQFGQDLMDDREVINGGVSSEIRNKYDSGKVGALIALRDSYLPKITEQLDSLAFNLKKAFNNIHNNGVGFPIAQNLLSTTRVERAAEYGFAGNIRLVAMGLDGNSLPDVPPLTLDLGKFNSGSGPGSANIQGIMNEINYHFVQRMAVDKKYQLGNISDVKLVSTSSSFSPSSTIKFDLELENFSQTNASIQILSASAADSTSASLTTNYLNTINTATAGAYTKIGSGAAVSLDLPATINYPIDLDLQLQVNDGANTYIGTVRYTISTPTPDIVNGLMNTRFSASSKPNLADPGVINNPPLSQGVLSISLTHDGQNGLNLTDNTSAFLRFQTNSNSYYIAIDNLDSRQVGIPGKFLRSDLNFSQFFGLNDLFVRKDFINTEDTIKNCALNLTVREDIQNNSSLFSKTKLMPLVDYTGSVGNTYRYTCAEGGAELLSEYTELITKSVYFAAAAGIPATSVSIPEYIASIIAFSASEASLSASSSYQKSLVANAIGDKLKNIRGVDINEELTNLLIFQQSFSASAKAIKMANDLYETLLQSF